MEIIAEIGSNHCGDFEIGKRLIDELYDSGITLIKMQLWKAEDLYKGADYDKAKPFELSFELAEKFFKYCKEMCIDLFFSVFYEDAVDFCERIDVRHYKIAARTVENTKLVKKVLETGKPTYISFSSLYGDPIKSYNSIRELGYEFTPMYTVSKYPSHIMDVNFKHFSYFANRNGGFSNHDITSSSVFYADLHKMKVAEIHMMLDDQPDSPDTVCSWKISELRDRRRFIDA